jgi:tRNA(Arg) A34 adenosine deaminase TadA
MTTDHRKKTILARIKSAGPFLLNAALITGIVGSISCSASKIQKLVAKAPAKCDAKLINRLLEVIEKDIIPLTQEAVVKGNKIFGAAILKKSDLFMVVASPNNETENPLWHGEVHVLKTFYELPKSNRPNTQELIFLATHEPCTLCLSAITWTGFDNFYYLFSHEDSRDSFKIPHDLKILQEVFKCGPGEYAQENFYWKSYHLKKLINNCDEINKKDFLTRIYHLEKNYRDLSDVYQKNKDKVDMPLK